MSKPVEVNMILLPKGTTKYIEYLEGRSAGSIVKRVFPKGCIHPVLGPDGKTHACKATTSASNGWVCFRHEREAYGLPPIETGADKAKRLAEPAVSTVLCDECGRDVPKGGLPHTDHDEGCPLFPSNQAF